jgi:hypothetical protein
MRAASWLRLSRRDEAWKTAEILILRHQLTVLQRHQPYRPKLTRADRALLVTLLGVIPKARRQRLRLLIFGQRHLRTILAQYEAHYNGRRPHRSRQLHPPRPDHPPADLSQERIQRRPVLGGLISEYERAA